MLPDRAQLSSETESNDTSSSMVDRHHKTEQQQQQRRRRRVHYAGEAEGTLPETTIPSAATAADGTRSSGLGQQKAEQDDAQNHRPYPALLPPHNNRKADAWSEKPTTMIGEKRHVQSISLGTGDMYVGRSPTNNTEEAQMQQQQRPLGEGSLLFSDTGDGDETSSHENRRLDYSSGAKDHSRGSSLLEQLSEHTCPDDKKLTTAEIIRRIRLSCGQFVEEPRVQFFIIVLIVINAIMMGIATFDMVTDDPKIDQAFETTDRVFLVIFTIELALQIIYRSYTFLADSWLIFDFVIVIVSWSLESLQIVRAFRIFRAFRLVTRIGSLRELVNALGAVMPRMYAIMMLLFLIFYIFAVLFTELFSDIKLSDNYFGSLDQALFTCMELMTLEWAEVSREVMDQKPWAWAPILSFISVTGFIVFNLIVAVVCDAVAVVDREAFSEKHPNMKTDKEKLKEAQTRIQELTETVEVLMERQTRLLRVTDKLARDLRPTIQSPKVGFAAAVDTSESATAEEEEGEDVKVEKYTAHNDLQKLEALSTSIELDVQEAIEKINQGNVLSEDARTPSPSEVNGGSAKTMSDERDSPMGPVTDDR